MADVFAQIPNRGISLTPVVGTGCMTTASKPSAVNLHSFRMLVPMMVFKGN
jgi:hypothetical protein